MDPLGRRRRLVVGVAVLAVLFSAAGLGASRFVTSAEQQRASAAPPAASLLTAEVQRRVLASTVVTRGTVVAEKRLEVTPVVAGVGAQVVTGTFVAPGAQVVPGQVLVAVSGRPLVVLAGAVPGYRDLRPGTTGEDVLQLQEALRQLGHYRGGDAAGVFGTSTKAAVRSLYGKLRYDTPDTGGPGGQDDADTLAAAEAAVTAARREVDRVARRIADDEPVAPGEMPLAEQLALAKEQFDRVAKAQKALLDRTGAMMPLAEFVFVPDFPARVTAMSVTTGQQVKAPLVTLAAGDLAVTAKLRPDQAGLLRAGMPVHLTSEALGTEAEAMVTAVLDPTVDEAGVAYTPAVITPVAALATTWADLDVRVTITAAQTKEPVLVVPLSAISAGADSRTSVSVLTETGQLARVEVRAGVSGDGFAEVTPISGELHEGDHVMVGMQP